MAQGICDGIWNTSLGGYLPSASCRDFAVAAVRGPQKWLTWKELIILVQMRECCLFQQGFRYTNEAPWAKKKTLHFHTDFLTAWGVDGNWQTILYIKIISHTRPSALRWSDSSSWLGQSQRCLNTLRRPWEMLGFLQIFLRLICLVSCCSAGAVWSSQDCVHWPCQLEKITGGAQICSLSTQLHGWHTSPVTPYIISLCRKMCSQQHKSVRTMHLKKKERKKENLA